MPAEPQLNGAYYGPSIPPPRNKKAYHRPGRGGGSSCNPFSCCCNCLCGCIFNCIFQIIFTLLIIIGIVILALWLVFRPNKLKFSVDDASLTEFNLPTTNNTLYYNLGLNMTVRNPNKRLAIYYDTIEANAFYQGQRFHTTQLDPFHQGHKNTTFLHLVFNGQSIVLLGSNQMSNYNDEKASGMYSIDLKLRIRMRLKFWWFKSPKIKPTIDCGLKIPLNTNGRLAGTFERAKCGLDW